MSLRELIEAVADQSAQVVLAYAEANPMRTADFHMPPCGCLRCEVDRLEYAVDQLRAMEARDVKGEG